MNLRNFICEFFVLSLAFVLSAGFVFANSIASSTMIFEGDLAYNSLTGAYTGTINAKAGTYYTSSGSGCSGGQTPDGRACDGGFDVYAKAGATAYVLNYYGPGTDEYVIGSNHDAYPIPGEGGQAPWGDWWSPDVADWNQYSLELTPTHWYLRYTATGESPMSGTMNWATKFAEETDKGTLDSNDDGVVDGVYAEGGPHMWDWNAGQQVERIPLEYPGFDVEVDYIGQSYRVTLTPSLPPSGGVGAGDTIGGSINVEDFPIKVWQCGGRILRDEAVQPWRLSGDGETLIERNNNYMFEGETYQTNVLVMDKNKIDEAKVDVVFEQLKRGSQPDGEEVLLTLNCVPDKNSGYNGTGCYGTPANDTCENYNLEQCTEIEGCEIVCDYSVEEGDSIKDAIVAASPGDIICVAPGTYPEGLIDINKDLTIIGDPFNKPVLNPTEDTRNSDHRGWIQVMGDVDVEIRNLRLNGNGKNIENAIRYQDDASGKVENCDFSNIYWGKYAGIGVVALDYDKMNGGTLKDIEPDFYVNGCTFDNIQRIGMMCFGVDKCYFQCNTYTGKGDGDWLDYGIEIGGGAIATLTGNDISDCTGVASSDGSTSAGVLITTYYGKGTTADLQNNFLYDNTEGVAVGYDDIDGSTVTIDHNDIRNNDDGIGTSQSTSISLTVNNNNIYFSSNSGIDATGGPSVNAENNWWGCAAGPGSPGCDIVNGTVDYEPYATNKFDISRCEDQVLPICEGTPDSCRIVTDEHKCDYETDGCSWFSFEDCNGMIDEEKITEFDPDTMEMYNCIIEVPDSEEAYGEYELTVQVEDSDGLQPPVGYDETSRWFLNPFIEVSVNGDLNFNDVKPGTSSYSNVQVKNNAEGGVVLDMFILGEDWYSPTSKQGRCLQDDGKLLNKLPLSAFRYYVENGAYNSRQDEEVDLERYNSAVTRDRDSEGYLNIHKKLNAGFEERMFAEAEILQANPIIDPRVPGGRFWAANWLYPGGTGMTLTFRLNLPNPCYGTFKNDDAFHIYGEAI